MTTDSRGGEARARSKRPAGWIAPGPQPRGADGRAELAPGEEEDLSYLTGDFRIFQRKRGHRWSLDDFITALVAIEEARRLEASRGAPLARAVDLGCGIGSVLMMVAWGLPTVESIGIEAQALSFGLAQRSLAFNGLDDRVRALLGDLREVARTLPEGSIDLVTGTPPYIPLGSGLVSDKDQRGPACFEIRGGVEDYARAAAHLVAPGGRFVTCLGAQPETRGEDAVRAAGLVPLRRVDVIPKAGKPVLLRVVVAARADDPAAVAARGEVAIEPFVVRDEHARVTPQMEAARVVMGLPPSTT
jgi:tRNA1Val (adenine37-N6)-methyltransferase